mmetsp:Transcript_9518/g.21204  ORF Transcript_9518/g.21204 Transcript_9518/m.21204 type:complete len:85 (-) Transcript_9518:984-1238(-)
MIEGIKQSNVTQATTNSHNTNGGEFRSQRGKFSLLGPSVSCAEADPGTTIYICCVNTALMEDIQKEKELASLGHTSTNCQSPMV